MEDRLDKILEVATDQEKAEVAILHNAQVDTAKAYQAEPSAANKRDWDAAKKGYEEQLESLWRKYFLKGQVVGSRNAAKDWLNDQGYKIGKQKVYDDAALGRIRVQTDGSILVSDLELYAKAFLDESAAPGQEDADSLQEKTKLEVQRLRIKLEEDQLKLDKEKGKHIPRRDFEGELAARAVVLEAGVNNLIFTRARDWLFEAGADPKLVGRVMDAMKADFRGLFNAYASTDSFQVVFIDDEE